MKTLYILILVLLAGTAYGQLDPSKVKIQPSRDAVAIIIGIGNYKKIPKADYANADAQAFYDYAIRALGIKPENITLLIDESADDIEIRRAFQSWLPLKVKKGKTEVFVFFSGHGLASQDGKSLYFLPWGVDKDFVEKTAINQQEIIASLQSVQPKSVTMFIDSCYSGQARGGEALSARSRPIALKAEANAYPPNFTVISASASDQLSSSSPDLKHGIFSYFLMKGMEGDADQNKDGKITVAEIQEYLTDMVGRQAMGMNRKQQPQFFGDADRVLMVTSRNNTAPAVSEAQNRESDQTKAQLEQERLRLAEDRLRVNEDNRRREFAKTNRRINLEINNTQPSADGDLVINIQTNTDTASLKINGEEQGGRVDGKYSVMRVARAGQETRFEIYAKDIYGNTETKTITVSRTLVETKVAYPILNPAYIKRQPERDAVAVIIGISNYKNLPKADFAKDDAQVFSDYAIRALGVPPGNIKLLMDEQADADEIYTAFKTWLPARVKSTTDVYVFYSGHGLPTQDGSGLYWLPQRANRDLISKTGILLSEINSDIQASKPKSVTIFMDACYSGQARGGETLVASARPIALKSQPTTFPSNFTVISASQADQISSSSPELQHGIFSYYLMRGMEGEADLNKDGKITLDEIQRYLSENVGRQARIMNRQQEPQVIGDGSKVLIVTK